MSTGELEARADPPPGEDEALARRDSAPLYRVFSRLLLAELDAQEIARLSRPEIVSTWESVAPGSRAWLADANTSDRLQAARVEYARLFLVPGVVRPRAAGWLEADASGAGAAVGQLAARALTALGRDRRSSEEPQGRVPLDHAGLLCELVAIAAERRDPLGDRVAGGLARAALDPWVGVFGAALAEASTVPVYRGLGALLAGLHPPPLTRRA